MQVSVAAENVERSELRGVTRGLSSAEAARRLAAAGPNRLPDPPMAGPSRIFLRQFLSPFIYILLCAVQQRRIK